MDVRDRIAQSLPTDVEIGSITAHNGLWWPQKSARCMRSTRIYIKGLIILYDVPVGLAAFCSGGRTSCEEESVGLETRQGRWGVGSGRCDGQSFEVEEE